jgi:hypothetical protein
MKIRKVYEEDSWADYEAKAEKEALDAQEYIVNNLKGSKLGNFINLQNEYIKTKKEILKLVNEYTEIREKQDPEDDRYWLGQYGFDKRDIAEVDIKTDKYGDLSLYLKARWKDKYDIMRDVDFQEFLKYIEDAEIYKNSKKFNI